MSSRGYMYYYEKFGDNTDKYKKTEGKQVFGFSKGRDKRLLAACDGEVFSVEKVSDEVFAGKILGDGFAQMPESGTVCAPVGGVLSEAAETGHAYCIDADDGTQVLVHIGIDTVKLAGEGFSPKVKKGDRVSAGQPLAETDFDKIRKSGYDCSVIAVICNMDKISSIEIKSGRAKGGEDTALLYKLKGGR